MGVCTGRDEGAWQPQGLGRWRSLLRRFRRDLFSFLKLSAAHGSGNSNALCSIPTERWRSNLKRVWRRPITRSLETVTQSLGGRLKVSHVNTFISITWVDGGPGGIPTFPGDPSMLVERFYGLCLYFSYTFTENSVGWSFKWCLSSTYDAPGTVHTRGLRKMSEAHAWLLKSSQSNRRKQRINLDSLWAA